jgi:hypothetical protein
MTDHLNRAFSLSKSIHLTLSGSIVAKLDIAKVEWLVSLIRKTT